MTVWVLGDQLTRAVGPLATRDEPVLLIEARAFARRLPYHPHKLALVFSAMRHFRDELRDEGIAVDYYEVETFADGLAAHFAENPGDELVVMEPPTHGAAGRLRELVEREDGTLDVVENDLFFCSPETYDEWAGDGSVRHESFYRFMRRRTGYLMDGDEPAGGEWNYDDRNRQTPPDSYDPPKPPRFEPDGTTREVVDWVETEFDGSYERAPYGGAWADPGPFRWPVSREEALAALDHFVDHRLAEFGPYQDAMLRGEWALSHSLLSSSLNLGLLHPREVVERAVAAHENGDVPINSAEGFVRQVLGWREYMRHVYRREMPGMDAANQLDAQRDLPAFYWTGETDMACLADVIEGVRTRGYSHHIERLMVLSNFALLYGVRPAALNRWFHAAYVDAYHWVTTPNVVGMGLFGTDVVATKPYAASANYVDRMSDYCAGCRFDPDETTGPDACPFNALYWDFLAEHEDELRSNHRMGLVYSHLDDKRGDRLDAIRARAARLRSDLGGDESRGR